MTLFTAEELRHVLEPLGYSSLDFHPFSGVKFDSRLITPGDLFIALPGKEHDGHAFVKNALAKGAAAVLVSEPVDVEDQAKVIRVANGYQALKALSAYARQRSNATIAAITGSVGKTTVKEGLSFVLSRQQPTVKSPNSYNNDLGVALSLIHLRKNDRFGVFEVGMNQSGETAPLAQTIRPHVAIITAIGPVHIEYLKTIEAIALEKSALFSGVGAGGIAIIPRDSPFYPYLKEQAENYSIKHIISFGYHDESTVQLKKTSSWQTGQTITAVIEGQEIQYNLQLNGEHNALNSLAILAGCLAMNADVQQAARDLEFFSAVEGRGKVLIIPYKGGNLTIMDESYNANLLSMGAALKNLAAFPSSSGRKIAVLGDMKELGPHAFDHHQQIGQLAVNLKIDKIAVCGVSMETAYDQLSPQQKLAGVATSQELIPFLQQSLKAGDVVMIKGSLSMRMKTIVRHFIENI